MATFLHRINGGEVLGVSTDPNAYAGLGNPLLAVKQSPPIPDGTDLVPAKIWDGISIRDATAPEIANFVTATATDTNIEIKQTAQDLVDVEIIWRKTLKALVLTLIEEVNTLRTLHSLPDRTLAQAVASIKSKIANEDVT